MDRIITNRPIYLKIHIYLDIFQIIPTICYFHNFWVYHEINGVVDNIPSINTPGCCEDVCMCVV